MAQIKNTEPLISIVIPVYQIEGCLGICLDCVRAQTYRNLEIIVVDDGSTDGSGKICDAYAEQDGRFQVFHLPKNRGVSHARNTGLRKAAGAYVSFVDGDDCVERNMIRRLYDSLIENRADISMCGILQAGFGTCSDDRDILPGTVSGEQAVRYMVEKKTFLGIAGRLFKAETVKEHFFDETLSIGEDTLFLFQTFRQAHLVSYVPDRLYHYIYREGSAMQRESYERRYFQILAYDRLYRAATENYPNLVPVIGQMLLEANVRQAVEAVENRQMKGGELYRELKKLQKKIRCHMSGRVLALFPCKKIAAETVLLYGSAVLFWTVTIIYKGIGRLGNGEDREDTVNQCRNTCL